MEITLLKKNGEHYLLKVEGDVLMENSKDFYNGIKEIFGGKNAHLSLDFSRVQFIDSSGIGSLIKLTSELKRENFTINVIGLNKNLKTVFQLSGISTIIKIKTQSEFCIEHPEFQDCF
jgi:anti-anti-sigma factor